MQLVFDGHNDVLLRLWKNAGAGSDPVAEFSDGTPQGHLDLPRSRAGGLAGGLCAIFVPSGDLILKTPDVRGHYQTPLGKPVEPSQAANTASEIVEIAVQLDQAGAWKVCRSTRDIRVAVESDMFAAVLHMEGCEAIGPELAELQAFYDAGLRSIGPVWSRHNIFGHGVPFAYPSSPDTAPGLTEAGFALVRECNRLGIAIDLAHITDRGFWDVVETSDGPLIASHSNAHALTPVARNLTDRQLDAIGERSGIVGLNFATTMLRADGQEEATTPLSDMVRHIDYLVRRMGIECVGIGSDFDGATIPEGIGDAAGTQNLVAALRDAGYSAAELALICKDNWLRVLGKAWHEYS